MGTATAVQVWDPGGSGQDTLPVRSEPCEAQPPSPGPLERHRGRVVGLPEPEEEQAAVTAGWQQPRGFGESSFCGAARLQQAWKPPGWDFC